jgi:hypothetical protein
MPWLRKSSWSSTPQRARLSNPHWRTWTPELAPDEPLDGHGHGQYEQADSASGGATTSSASGSRWLASTMSVSTPDVVALAATPATAGTTISMQAKAQRTRSTGLWIRRSS